MRHLLLDRYLPACAAAVLLASCSIATGSNFSPVAGVAAKNTASGTLLYVANVSASRGVDIVTFPQGKRIATIANIGAPQGVCADTAGHVWITAYVGGPTFALYEFARGATTPLHTVRRKAFFKQCAIDPHGNVAVLTSGTAYHGSIETWPPSLQGKPHVTRITDTPYSGAYDASGNLYFKAFHGSDPVFAVLPQGSTKVRPLRIKGGSNFLFGCVGWDGTYVTLGAFGGKAPPIYRLVVHKRIAKVVSIVRLQEAAVHTQYVLAGQTMVATVSGAASRRIGLYDYPAGGKPTAIFSGFYNPTQLAISSP